MRQYDIPTNPNRRMLPVSAGLQLRWSRILLLIVAIAAVMALYPKNGRSAVVIPNFVASPAPLQPTAELIALPSAPIEPAAPDYRAIISRANAAFRAGRAQADPAALHGVAAGAWLQYEQQYIAELRRQNESEQWSLTSFVITSEALHGEAAAACTTEQWERSVRHADGSVSVLPPLSLVEHYRLVREDGRWMVADIQFMAQGCTA